MREVTIAVTQFACDWDLAANADRAEAAVRAAAQRGAQVVLVQELFATPYFCITQDPRHFALAAPFEGHPLIARFADLARELGVVLPVSFFERAGEAHFNTVAMVDADGRILGCYRKSHIPQGPGYEEKFYFSPGDTGFRVWETAAGRIGVAICWDQWFPEAARLTALHGASILFYPTAIGWHAFEKDEWGEAQRNAWESIQRSHAIANGVFVAAVNRVGIEGGLQFWGNSFACDPFGRVIVRAEEREETLIAECDMGLLREIRRAWPFLRDRRIDAYGGIMERYLDGRRR